VFERSKKEHLPAKINGRDWCRFALFFRFQTVTTKNETNASLQFLTTRILPHLMHHRLKQTTGRRLEDLERSHFGRRDRQGSRARQRSEPLTSTSASLLLLPRLWASAASTPGPKSPLRRSQPSPRLGRKPRKEKKGKLLLLLKEGARGARSALLERRRQRRRKRKRSRKRLLLPLPPSPPQRGLRGGLPMPQPSLSRPTSSSLEAATTTKKKRTRQRRLQRASDAATSLRGLLPLLLKSK